MEIDFARHAPPVQRRWAAFEADVVRVAVTVETAAEAARRAGRTAETHGLLTGFMDRTVARWSATLDALLAELPAAG